MLDSMSNLRVFKERKQPQNFQGHPKHTFQLNSFQWFQGPVCILTVSRTVCLILTLFSSNLSQSMLTSYQWESIVLISIVILIKNINYVTTLIKHQWRILRNYWWLYLKLGLLWALFPSNDEWTTTWKCNLEQDTEAFWPVRYRLWRM